jgi:hypothetical protein
MQLEDLLLTIKDMQNSNVNEIVKILDKHICKYLDVDRSLLYIVDYKNNYI